MPLVCFESDVIMFVAKSSRRLFLLKAAIGTAIAVFLLVFANIFIVLPAFEKNMMNDKKMQVENVTNIVVEMLDSLEREVKAGFITEQEAKRQAFSYIKSIRYGKTHDDYFWVFDDVNKKILLHPLLKDGEIMDAKDMLGPDGDTVILKILDSVKGKDHGYIQYLWFSKKDGGESEQKLSYNKRFKPWGWVIGTGIYLDDVRNELAAMNAKIFHFVIGIIVAVAIMLLFLLIVARRSEREIYLTRRALSESNVILEASIEGAPDAFLVVFNDGHISHYNSNFLKMWGVEADELSDMKFSQLKQIIDSKISGSAVFESDLDEFKVILNDGRRIEVRSRPLIVQDEYLGKVWQFRDVTSSELARKERELLLKSLSEKNDELASIMFIASHDLRSPIINIEGFSGELLGICKETSALMSQIDMPEDQRLALRAKMDEVHECISFINSGTSKIDSLLRSLLKVCRVGAATLEPTKLDMNEMISSIIKIHGYQIRQAGADVTIEELLPCYGDRAQINQVFSNLIDNAIKYIDKNKKPIIHISSRESESMVIYCVKDNGVGINEKYQSKIFEIFHRLYVDSDVQGEGIGLTVVKRIVKRHTGNVWVENNPDGGCSFYVSLPKDKVSLDLGSAQSKG